MPKQLTRVIGIIGVLVSLAVYIHTPSFPSPDKLLVFLTFIFMALGQGWEFFKRMAPFVGLLLIYESFRGLADRLNTHVNYVWMISADRFLFFGRLPTKILQNWWWQGHVGIADFVFYVFYMLHFVLPFATAILIWKKRTTYYWRYVATIVTVSFAGFLTFLLFPAAPPWLAQEAGYIEPITHVSSFIWQAMGIHDFPSVYNKISPNLVAAVPSLHAAYATIVALFIIRLFKNKWRYLVLIYPFMIYLGTVYMGEHYVIDEIAGIVYALAAYVVVAKISQKFARSNSKPKHKPRAILET